MRSWSSVLWAVQTKLKQEDSTRRMVEAFQNFGLNWGAFPLPPYVGRVPVFPWDGLILYYGSTKLVQLVQSDESLREKAAFFYSPETHSVSWYGPKFGSDYLNALAVRTTAGRVFDIVEEAGLSDFFVRPDAGVKLFSGGVMDRERFQTILDQETALGPDMVLNPDSLVWVNHPLEIDMELRTWWIGGEVVALVGYRRNGRIDPWLVDEQDPLYKQIRDFATEQGSKIAEVEAVVLDVAVTPLGLKVVEINCIHTSGFYRPEVISDVVCELTRHVLKTR